MNLLLKLNVKRWTLNVEPPAGPVRISDDLIRPATRLRRAQRLTFNVKHPTFNKDAPR